jgi:tagatose-1,6-bisphosphate aldolase non-catalytic subunit AgaZ/GatZ
VYDRYGDTAGTKVCLLLRALNAAMGYRRTSNRDILFEATRQQVRRVGEKVPTATRDVVPF